MIVSPPDVAVVFEDEWIVAVNKPAGWLVHASVNANVDQETRESLEDYVRRVHAKNAVLLHRLDRATTGIVLFAKRREVAGPLTQAIEARRIRKAYLAVVRGAWPKSLNRIESRIAPSAQKGKMQSLSLEQDEGAQALTTFRALCPSESKSWIEAILKTGRQHQIRAHCESAGHAILGDLLYGGGEPGLAEAPLALHAYRMDFQHPRTKAELKLIAPPPSVWQSTWLQGMEFGPVWERLFGAPSGRDLSGGRG